ncbi:hypothetical protein [Clostridium transplantifaecale]|uniref:hypothetical protein n=1 Tax=Clostridium transplantifaecale TaxID=2479838 RepID=UPI001FA9FE40|nr:hypothetical protein [Clostridium transplantifaecale]
MIRITQSKISVPNLLNICVDHVDQGDYSGKIWNLYEKTPVTYVNTMDMLRKMDLFFNRLDFPQESTVCRSFGKAAERGKKRQEEAVRQMEPSEMFRNKGEKATFIINVKYRQNATWQGEVIWVDKKETKFFRSALELLKLMDSAMDTQEMSEG